MDAPAGIPDSGSQAHVGIPLREFFRRFGIEVHEMVTDGKPVDVDEMRVFGFTPANADGSPNEAGFIPVPIETQEHL